MDWTTQTSVNVEAWYHMYGTSMGTMHFDIRVGSGSWTLDYIPSWTDNLNAWQLRLDLHQVALLHLLSQQQTLQAPL